MQIQQLSIKYFVNDASAIALDDYIPIFHKWIREKRIPDQLLIDVADYRHVPDGPGIMMIAHEAHYGIDSTFGGPGLLYSAKRDPLGPAGPKLKDALRHTLMAAVALEGEPVLGGKVTFDAGRFTVRVVSRLVAANDDASFASLKPELETFLGQAFPGAGIELARVGDARDPLSVEVRVSGAPALADTLKGLE